jgi:nucleotide-binding universal stress UspA family protein
MGEASHPSAPPAERAEGRLTEARRALVGPLLVGGEEASPLDGALRLAQLLARRDRVNAHVLTVVRPLALPSTLLAGIDREAWEEGRRQRQLAVVRQRLHQTVGVSAHFSVSAERGSPAPTIARVARERGAELVLVGIEAHGAPGRAQTEDAALQVTRTADVPVVAVPPDRALLPRRALVAMDFSEASVRAARAAILALTSGGSLTLAHVEPDVEFRELGKEGWGEIYARGVAGLFEQLAGELRVPGEVDVDTVVLRGDAPAVLLELAARGGFDLIAAGSQAAPWVEWHLTGSVSTSLLRGARCAVLIAPPVLARR